MVVWYSYPQVYPQINLTVKNTICPGVEESGVKWSMEHLDRCVRNVQDVQTYTTQTSILSNPQTFIADYTPKPPICQTFIAQKTLYKIARNVQLINKKE
jgi:hypothetical protein